MQKYYAIFAMRLGNGYFTYVAKVTLEEWEAFPRRVGDTNFYLGKGDANDGTRPEQFYLEDVGMYGETITSPKGDNEYISDSEGEALKRLSK